MVQIIRQPAKGTIFNAVNEDFHQSRKHLTRAMDDHKPLARRAEPGVLQLSGMIFDLSSIRCKAPRLGKSHQPPIGSAPKVEHSLLIRIPAREKGSVGTEPAAGHGRIHTLDFPASERDPSHAFWSGRVGLEVDELPGWTP